MKISQLLRIELKILLGFLLAVGILFWNTKEVNYSVQPKYDFIPTIAKNIKTEKKVQKTENENVKIEKEITHKISVSPVEKRKFLLKLVISALKEKHSAAISPSDYEKLCNYYDWCEIIELGDFSYVDKVYYTAFTIHLLEFVNKYFPKLKETLYYIKIKRDTNWRRWYAGHHSIIILVKENMSYKQFFEVLTHELWHVIDLGVLEWDGWFKSKEYTEFWKVVFYKNDPSLDFYKLSWLWEKIKKPDAYISDFVSWYWMTNTFEDFAECFNMYLNHNWVFRQMATESNILRKKYNFLAKYFKGKYIYSDKNFIYKQNFRPWDSTKFSN